MTTGPVSRLPLFFQRVKVVDEKKNKHKTVSFSSGGSEEKRNTKRTIFFFFFWNNFIFTRMRRIYKIYDHNLLLNTILPRGRIKRAASPPYNRKI